MVGGYLRHVTGENRGNLPIFSNPLIYDERCGPDGVCGHPLIGDAARTLNEHAHYYAGLEQPDVHTLHYASERLRACIREQYRYLEIVDLEELTCPNMGIDSLEGLQQLTDLLRVNLSGNLIQDISVLKKLSPSTIEVIDLSGNHQIRCLHLESLVARLPGKVIQPETCIMTQ